MTPRLNVGGLPLFLSLALYLFSALGLFAQSSSCQPETVYIDLGLQIDKEFADQFTDVADAKDFAMAAASVMHQIWFQTGTQGDLPYLNFDVVVNIVWMPAPYLDPADDLYPTSGSVVEWRNEIRKDWADNRPCIAKDGIIYLTGLQGKLGTPSARGVTDNMLGYFCKEPDDEYGNRVSIVALQKVNGVPNASETGLIMAHELGHQFGLFHENEPVSSGGCDLNCIGISNPGYLMCSSSEGTDLSSCMKIILNGLWADVPPFGIRCPCLAEHIPKYESEDCALCYAKATSVTTDNSSPVTGCTDGSPDINFTATLKGGCQPASNVIVRARFNPAVLTPLLGPDGKVVSDYFTDVIEIKQSGIVIAKELIRLKDDGSGDEDVISLMLKDEMLVHFLLTFDPQPGAEAKAYAVQVYLGSVNMNFSEAIITPYFTRVVQAGETAADLFSPADPYRNFHIIGDVEMPYNGNPSGTTDYNLQDYNLLFDPGNTVHVRYDARLLLANTTLAGCSTMWQGIQLDESSGLFSKSSAIADAQYAVDVKGFAIVNVQSTRFHNNNIGVVARPPAGSIRPSLTLLGNEYGTTASGLKPAFAGQTPVPLEKGFSGVYIKDVGALNFDASPQNGEPNKFYNLKFGILSKNNQLRVGSATFNDITNVPKGNGYSDFTTSSTGKAIYAENGLASIWKNFGSILSFDNCHTGVETMDASSWVFYTEMTNVNNGIIATNCNYALPCDNEIHAHDRGIELRHASPLAIQGYSPAPTIIGGVYANTITMEGNPNGIGIGTFGNTHVIADPHGPQSSPIQFTGGNIASNMITMIDGANAINLYTTRNISTYHNTISLENTQGKSFGIALGADEYSLVSCNSISDIGAAENTGIYAIHSSLPELRCNLAEKTTRGIHFDGMLIGKAEAVIAGNTMKDNTTALLYGTDAVTGKQIHQGNRFEGSNSFALNQSDVITALLSKYTVDATEGQEYLPDSWNPLLWFEDIYEEEATYACSFGAGLCIHENEFNGEGSELQIVETIARGQLPGSDYQAANNWLAQRRLYERISETGNPYPESADIINFLAAADTNGIAAYANMQTGIRQIFAVSQNDQDSLQEYERQIMEGLDTLVVLERLLFASGVTVHDSIALANKRQELLDAIWHVAQSKTALTDEIDSVRAVAATVLFGQNNNLPDLGTSYANKEKTVNDILLRTMARGIYTFSLQDSATLVGIAAACPLSDGEAVLRARGLLTLVLDLPASYDNETICVMERGRTGKTLSSDLPFRLYPNPAADKVMIEYNPTDKPEYALWFFNTLGQIVKVVELPNDQQSIQISLAEFSKGVYWYKLSNTGMPGGKLIINR